MRSLFTVARKEQPSVIFFDEIDAMMSARKVSIRIILIYFIRQTHSSYHITSHDIISNYVIPYCVI